MEYTFYAVSCYIVLRGLQTIFEEYKEKKWYKIIVKTVAGLMILIALLAVLNQHIYYNFLLVRGMGPSVEDVNEDNK